MSKLNEIKYYLDGEMDKQELKNAIIEEINMLNVKGIGNVSIDECGIEWDGKEICNLDEFINEYNNNFIEKMCNIIDSFKKIK